MSGPVSSYYPPRAHWYSPVLGVAERLRCRLRLNRLDLTGQLRAPGLLASLVLPGVAFYLSAPARWGRPALWLAGILVITIVIWFGYSAATVAGGLLISLHACGLTYIFDKATEETQFRRRLLLGLAILVALVVFLYLPARNLVQQHWLVPLRLHDRVIVVLRESPSVSLRRGEQVAYSFETVQGQELIIRGGYGLGALLALPGDRVRFTPEALEVNGVPYPRLPLMPEGGEWVVPQKHWFVWPGLAISSHGHAPASALSQTLVNLGTISELQFVGKPLRHWLWRRQLEL